MAQSTTKKKTTKSSSKAPAKGGKSAKNSKSAPQKKPIRREVAGGIFALLGVLVLIGNFDTSGSTDGFLVRGVCNVIKGLLGYGFYAVAPIFLLTAVILIFHYGRPITWRTTASLFVPVFASAFLDTVLSKLVLPETPNLVETLYKTGVELHSGGVIGGLLSYGLSNAIYKIPTAILLFLLMAVFLVSAIGITPKKIKSWREERNVPEYEEQPIPERKPKREKPVKERPAAKEEAIREPEVRPVKPVHGGISIPADEPEPEPEKKPDVDPLVGDDDEESGLGILRHRSRVRPPEMKREPSEPNHAKGRVRHAEPEKPVPEKKPEVEPVSMEEAEKIAGVEPIDLTGMGRTGAAEVSDPPKKMSGSEMAAQTAAVAQEIESAPAEGVYEKPPIYLLKKGHSAAVDTAEELRTNRERLESAIKSFGVNATVVDMTNGPTVTRYDVELERGVKLTKLTNLANDIALALGVVSVRIAPIPDKISTVGIEVPNKLISTVYLRDIIDSPAFHKSKSNLSFAIGKDIGGNAVVGNISKLPHLLIAGTTGSGKSVCMNSLIISLLYKSDPEDVKLIMIDPKMVEMGVYNGIPHLYIPVVTDPKKAAGALQWAVTEMLKRYRLFSEIGVRSLEAYNEHLLANDQPKMPNVVVVIDELADLMLVASKDVEESICRVAQMGRAAGMHLVIATQRPSADVITGLMKANIPSRIAFAVSSGLESRIILDNVGAEKLIGMGDMLYAPLGCGKPLRVQGAFVSDEERDNIVSFIKEQSTAQYSDDIMAQIEKAAEDKNANNKNPEPEVSGGKGDFDELLPQAVDVIFDTKQASVSMLQRRLKLGYARAARIIDQMEEMGILGPFEGSKPRQILITKEQWMEMQMANGTAPLETIDPDDFDNF